MNTTELASRFGIEIETVGASRTAIANAIATVVGGRVEHDGYRDSVYVHAADGRKWSVVRDGSLNGGSLNGEIVSPILNYTDMETLQQIVRAVRGVGARADESCGIHVHVDGSRFDGRGVLNLVNMVHKNERLIERALGVSERRLENYTKAIESDFVARIDAMRGRSMADLQAAWYGTSNSEYARSQHYNQSRYHGLNLHSLFYRGTIEFRYFNGTLHAGEVKSYVQLVLALAEKALKAKGTRRARRVVCGDISEKWAFRVFLKALGLVGAEFETARHHLTKRLTGSSSCPGRVRAVLNVAPASTESE